MITFVVQGPVTEVTNETVKSIHKFYPGSEIIIASTNAIGVPGEKVVVIDKQDNNWNYHIESSKIVKYASNDLVCKVRSDIVFINNNLHLNNEDRLKDYKVFENRITCGNYHFCDPFMTAMNYHPSDWLFFGKKNDLIKLFDIKHYERIETDSNVNFVTPKGEHVYGNRVKRRPEQHFFISALQNSGYNIDIKFDCDNSDVNNGIKWLINNFYVLNVGNQAGFYCSKYPSFIDDAFGYLNNKEWNYYKRTII